MLHVPGRGCSTTRAFTLVELLVVTAIIGMTMAFVGPTIRSLSGAGNVNKAIGDVSGCLQSARAYAMATHTYVRVAVGKEAANAGSLNLASVFIAILSADGTLGAGTAADMSDSSKWPMLGKPLVLDNLLVDNNIVGTSTDTSKDVLPSSSDIPTFSRTVAGRSVSFNGGFIQFSPSGEARVILAQPARYIKIAMDKSSGALGQNPFILRLSGINGAVMVLRKGEGI